MSSVRLAGILPVLLCASVLAGCMNAPIDPGRGKVLAVVAGKQIFEQDVRDRLLDRYYGKRALLGVVREELFMREAVELGISVPAAAVLSRVEAELEAMLGELGNARDRFVADLEARGLSIEDLREELTREMQTRVLIERVARAHRVVTDAELVAVHQRTYAEDRVRLSHIAFAFGVRGAPPAEVVARTRRRAEEMLAQIRAGADFVTLARRHSENPQTARQGGEIGWVTREALEPEMAQVAFAGEVGTVSDPIRERDYGFHLLRIDERAPAQPLEPVRAELERELLELPPTQSEILRLEQTLRERHLVTLFLEELE